MSRSAATRARIQRAAITAFERDGFDATPVSRVAESANVTEMTVFRYFPTKASLVVDDPFDPVLADAIRAQPSAIAPFERALRGIAAALAGVDVDADDLTLRRVALIATTPALEQALAYSTARTRDAIRDALVANGADDMDAGVAATAVIAGMSAALLENARAAGAPETRSSMANAVRRAVHVLGGAA